MSRRKGLSFRVKEKKFNKKLVMNLLSWFMCIAITVFAAWVFVFCFVQRVTVIGEAMSDTVVNAENVFYNRFIYIISRPKQGDVIAFYPNGNHEYHLSIRRVAAVPGDTVSSMDGYLYVNDVRYEGPARIGIMNDVGCLKNPITLKDNEYFVICDNINAGEDSRSGNVGYIAKEDIVGKIWLSASIAEKDIHLIH